MLFEIVPATLQLSGLALTLTANMLLLGNTIIYDRSPEDTFTLLTSSSKIEKSESCGVSSNEVKSTYIQVDI